MQTEITHHNPTYMREETQKADSTAGWLGQGVQLGCLSLKAKKIYPSFKTGFYQKLSDSSERRALEIEELRKQGAHIPK